MKDLKIECPQGYKIDEEISDLKNGIIKFKKQNLTYEDIAKELFYFQEYYYSDNSGRILKSFEKSNLDIIVRFSNNSITKEQLESILTLNKLCNVAKYLNKEWLPNWHDEYEKKYYISVSLDELLICPVFTTNDGSVYFKSKELAKRAIEILGEKEIKKALILNH